MNNSEKRLKIMTTYDIPTVQIFTCFLNMSISNSLIGYNNKMESSITNRETGSHVEGFDASFEMDQTCIAFDFREELNIIAEDIFSQPESDWSHLGDISVLLDFTFVFYL